MAFRDNDYELSGDSQRRIAETEGDMSGGKWQEDFQFSRVLRLAKADEGTSPPSTVAVGSNIDWDSEADWTAQPFEFSDEDFEITAADTDPINARGAGMPLKAGQFRDVPPFLIDSFQTTTDEAGDELKDWAGNWDEDNGVYTPKQTVSRKAVIIEFEGLCFVYFPSVEIWSGITQASKRRFNRGAVLFVVMATADNKFGQEWHHNKPASP